MNALPGPQRVAWPSRRPAGAPVLDLIQRRLERALRGRARYRYVRPRVLREGQAYRVESRCCSRNVDPQGGVIDIALLTPAEHAGWQLHARDHAAGAWVAQHSGSLDELLELLCVDAQRRYWP